MDMLPGNTIDVLALAWLTWLILRPVNWSDWKCLLEVRETGQRVYRQVAGRDR
jgi:hypothetical protein